MHHAPHASPSSGSGHSPWHPPVEPFAVKEKTSAAELVRGMAGTSFQARNLAQAAHIWRHMLEDEVTIFLGPPGGVVPAGMRDVIRYLVENRLVDGIGTP